MVKHREEPADDNGVSQFRERVRRAPRANRWIAASCIAAVVIAASLYAILLPSTTTFVGGVILICFDIVIVNKLLLQPASRPRKSRII